MHRLLPIGASLVAAAALSLTAASADATTATSFALKASAVGAKAVGGQVPAQGGNTGFAAIDCTNLAGLDRTNSTVSINVPNGSATATGSSSHVYTRKVGGRVSSFGVHKIEHLVLVQNGAGTLSIDGISSTAHAYHDKNGYHAETTSTIGAISFTSALGGTQTIPVPDPGQSVPVPGLGTVGFGSTFNHHSATNAHAQTSGVVIKIDSSDTTVRLAQAKAGISTDRISGLFHGHANAVNASALGGVAAIGPQANLLMPCTGTDGKVRTKSGATAPLSGGGVDLLDLAGVQSQERASKTKDVASGYTLGRIEHVNLGGQGTIDGIVGRINVTWNKETHKYKVNTKGTTVGSAVFNGQTYSFPQMDGQEIPGLGRIDTDVFTKRPGGGTVTAVRITLLDDTGAPTGTVINLGNAALRITR